MGNKISQHKQKIFIKKDQEKQHSEKVSKQWKEARRNFYRKDLPDKLSKHKFGSVQQKSITSFFINRNIVLDLYQGNLKSHREYQSVIKPLYQKILSIEEQFTQKERECFPITSIIRMKINTLKSIHIQYEYQSKINSICKYSVSAFELFKIIDRNKLLAQVSLKGVEVQQFQQLLKYMNPANKMQIEHVPKQWIKNIFPNKSLRLSIDAKMLFDIKKETGSQINDLVYFGSLFFWISGQKLQFLCYLRIINLIFKITINEQFFVSRSQFKNDLPMAQQLQQDYRNGLKSTNGQIHCLTYGVASNKLSKQKQKFMEMEKYWKEKFHIQDQQYLESLLPLQKLRIYPSFVKNAQLGLQFLCRKKQLLGCGVKSQDFIQQQSNHTSIIKYLALYLYWCKKNPILPDISLLQSICLRETSFRDSAYFFRNLTEKIPKIRFIFASGISEPWKIEQNLFNQLQTLILVNCHGIDFDLDRVHSTSKLKHLRIQKTSFHSDQYLPLMFCKLPNLQYLSLSYLGFDRQILCIASQNLTELHINMNPTISDECLRMVDQKWPRLKILELFYHHLGYGQMLTQAIWSICKFSNLMEVKTNRILFGKDETLQGLRCRGIKISFYQ